MTKTYAIYRHGGAGVGKGASKIYTRVSLNYDGTDGLGPLTAVSPSLNVKASWWKVAGETVGSANNNGCGIFVPYTVSPFNGIDPLPDNDHLNKDYVLLSPVNANTNVMWAHIDANTCVSPGGSYTGPEGASMQPSPGTIYTCNGATNSGCASQSLSSAVVKANFLWIEKEAQLDYPLVSMTQYFMGGLRMQAGDQTGTQTLNTNSPISWTTVGFFGDNGITDDTTAKTFVTEYKTPPTMTPTNATGGSFDVVNGYWTLARTADNVSISPNGPLHSPAWLISNLSGAPSGLTVGGVTKVLNTDFVAVKADNTHLLVQYLEDVASSTTIAFTPSSAPTVPALQVTPGGLPSGQVGTPFQAVLTASGGVTPYTWAVTGALPVGLSLGASSGAIAGTPAQASISAFTIVLTDSTGQTAQEAISITIAAAGTGSGQVVITPSAPPAVNQGTTFQFTVNATGTWS